MIFEDADLDLAADIVTGVKFSNAGQICVAPNRVFVSEKVLKTFTEKVVSRAKAAKSDLINMLKLRQVRVIDERAFTRIKKLIDGAVADGATLLCGGDRPSNLKNGYYIAPTVLTDVTERMEVYKQETFGPIVSIIPFSDDRRLADMANDWRKVVSQLIFLHEINHLRALFIYTSIWRNTSKWG